MARLSTSSHQIPQQSNSSVPDSVRRSFIRAQQQTEKKVLVIEDCDLILLAYNNFIKVPGANLFSMKSSNSISDAIELFLSVRADIVICDMDLSGNGSREDGLEILKVIKQIAPNTVVALSTSQYSQNESIVDPDFLAKIKSAGFDAIFEKGDVKGIKQFILEHI